MGSSYMMDGKIRYDLNGFYIESEFFDDNNFYVNAILTAKPTKKRVEDASKLVLVVADEIAAAMNGVEGVHETDDDAWTVYEEEWWDKDGNIIEGDDVRDIYTVQRTIRR